MAICADCGGIQPTGCTCAFNSSDSVLITPSTSSLTTVTPSTRISAQSGNLIQDSSGLRTLTSLAATQYVNKPRVQVTRSNAIAFGSFTSDWILEWDVEVYDTLNMHDLAPPEALMATIDGLYAIGYTASYTLSVATPNAPYVALRLNRERVFAEVETNYTQDGLDASYQLYGHLFLREGDTIEVRLNNFSGATITQLQNSYSPFFWMHWVREHE